MTVLWVPLLVAAVGLAGIVWTQTAADRRSRAESDARTAAWQREHSLGFHARFLGEQWLAEQRMTMCNQVGSGDHPEPDWTRPMAKELGNIQLLGSKHSHSKAEELLRITAEMNSGEWGVGRYMELDEAKSSYVASVRRDLGLN